jgi:hypothetical protein
MWEILFGEDPFAKTCIDGTGRRGSISIHDFLAVAAGDFISNYQLELVA